MRRTAPRRHRGAVLIYAVVVVTAMMAFASLAVDVSHVRMVRIQLQGAADSAARAGAAALGSGVTAVQDAAANAAKQNSADGSSVVIDRNADIDFGTWSGSTFTVLSGSARSGATAIRVRCARTAAAGTAVRLTFSSLIGLATHDVSASATAKGTSTGVAGFIGYDSITAKNNTYFGSYNSAVTTSPTHSSSTSNVRIGSNGAIYGKNNNTLDGDVVLGPSGSDTGFDVSGSVINQSSDLAAPSLPTWSAGTNPNSISQNYTVSSNTTLPGGSYWFTSLTINASLTFSGPAVIYVNGPVAIGGTLAPTSGRPADLTLYQYGTTTFGDATANGMSITAKVIAPGSDFTAKNNLYFAGTGLFNSITTKNNADFYYDASLGAAGTNVVVTVQ